MLIQATDLVFPFLLMLRDNHLEHLFALVKQLNAYIYQRVFMYMYICVNV